MRKVSEVINESPVLRAFGNYDTEKASLESGQDDGGLPSLAVQSQKDEADINVIVKRFGVTGELPISQRIPLEVDIDEVLDYRTCLDRVKQAERSFATMPADVRTRFDNDPTKMVEFVMDDANREEALKLGMLRPARATDPGSSSSSSAPGGDSGSTPPSG